MKKNKDNKVNILAIIAGVLLGVFIFTGMQANSKLNTADPKQFYLQALENAETIPYLEFEELLNSGQVDEVYYCQTNENMVYTLYTEDSKQAEADGKDYSYTIKEAYITDYPANTDFRIGILHAGVDLNRIVLDEGTTLLKIITSWVPTLILIGTLIWWVSYSAPVKKVKEDDIIQTSNITFDDIIGLDETKEELNIIVNLIKNTISGKEIGARVPHGVLLSGPPGVGKTLIAKAIAHESGVPFINVSGSDFQEIYVGSGAKKVRELFDLARKKAPCIIFIDEFDAIGTSRNSHAVNSEDRKTINAFLKELDGFKPLEQVFILAATNFPEDLDSAVTRSGRFDREITIRPPKDWRVRLELFEFYFKDKKLAEDVNLESISKTLAGYTGADIASVCNESALVALGKEKKFIDMECIETAIDKKIFKGNYVKDSKMDADLRIVAYHEAGHAVASIILGETVSRASIRATTSGVGGAVFREDDESQFMTRKGMINRIKIAYAGRAAEEIFMGDVTTGAYNDFKQATENLKSYVNFVGFDNEEFGVLNYKCVNSHYISEEAVKRMTELSKKFYAETVELIKENDSMVKSLAEELLSREVMTGREIEDFFSQLKLESSVVQD